jgi:hypothetical protein
MGNQLAASRTRRFNITNTEAHHWTGSLELESGSYGKKKTTWS